MALTHRLLVVAASLSMTFGASAPSYGQASTEPIRLTLKEYQPLHIALDERIAIKRVGQTVTGTVVEPVYAYDRIAVPAGAKVTGHVAQLESPSKLTRGRTMLGGDFTPKRTVTVQFDTLTLPDGQQLAINTVVAGVGGRMKRQVAGDSKSSTKTAKKPEKAPSSDRPQGQIGQAKAEAISQAKQEIARTKEKATQKVTDALNMVKQPGRMERLKDAAINRLPYHPQYINKGTTYTVQLTSALDLGMAEPVERAPAESKPAPDSVLSARLVTSLDSSKSSRGTPITAIVTEPVFTADHQLVLPEGAELTGEVTFVKQASRFHRNGQLRFLFESVRLPGQDPTTMLASLESVDASEDDHVTVDEEGGVTVTNSKTRFIEPAVSVLLLRQTMEYSEHHHHRDSADIGGSTGGGSFATPIAVPSASLGKIGTLATIGTLGFGTIGAVASQFSAPAAIGFGALATGRALYTNFVGKGKEVTFQSGTPIQLRLAPGPTPAE